MSNSEEPNDSNDDNTDMSAKTDINSWRKRQSITNATNPLFQRRLSQGSR